MFNFTIVIYFIYIYLFFLASPDNKPKLPTIPVQASPILPESKPEAPTVPLQSSNTIDQQVTPAVHTLASDKWPACGVVPNSSYSDLHQMNMLRIIGGRPTQNGKWPWIVAVLNRFKVKKGLSFDKYKFLYEC